MEGGGGEPCERLWIGVRGKLPLPLGLPDARLERIVDIVKHAGELLAHKRIGDRLRRRGADYKAAARPPVAMKIDRERRLVDPPKRLAQSSAARERVLHGRPGAITFDCFQVDRLLVTEGCVEARPVHSGRGADVIERCRRVAAIPEGAHRLGQRLFRIVGARPSTRALFFFLYHLE